MGSLVELSESRCGRHPPCRGERLLQRPARADFRPRRSAKKRFPDEQMTLALRQRGAGSTDLCTATGHSMPKHNAFGPPQLCAYRMFHFDSARLWEAAQFRASAKCFLFGKNRCRVALKSGTRRVGQRLLPLIVTFTRQLVGVFPCCAVRSGQLRQEGGAPFQTHEARQLLRTHRGQCLTLPP